MVQASMNTNTTAGPVVVKLGETQSEVPSPYCKNCHQHFTEHAEGGKCLFEPTSFEPEVGIWTTCSATWESTYSDTPDAVSISKRFFEDKQRDYQRQQARKRR